MTTHDRRALLILGMHRSGTSALTRVLSLCGAALPRAVMPANAFNQTGYWEPVAIVSIHDRLLAEAGSRWDDPGAFPQEWFETERAEAYVDELAATIAAEYGDAPFFVMKDPRTCRLMPLWRRALARLGITPIVVIVARHPLEVAASLRRREAMPDAHAFLLWLEHVLAAEVGSRGLPRTVVTYDQLLDDWASVVGRIAGELGLPLASRTPELDAEVGVFLDASLRSVHLGSDALEAAGVPDAIRQVYAWCRQASGGVMPASDQLDRVRADLSAAGGDYLPSIRWLLGKVGQQEAHLTQLRAETVGREAAIADLLAQRHVQDQRIQELTARALSLEARIAQLDAQALEAATALAAVQAHLEATRRERADLELQRNLLASRLAARDATWVGRLQKRLARTD